MEPRTGNSAPSVTSSVLSEWNDHFPQPPCNILPNAVQDAINLSDKDILMAHVQLGVRQDPQVFFCQAAFQLVDHQHNLIIYSFLQKVFFFFLISEFSLQQ